MCTQNINTMRSMQSIGSISAMHTTGSIRDISKKNACKLLNLCEVSVIWKVSGASGASVLCTILGLSVLQKINFTWKICYNGLAEKFIHSFARKFGI